MLILEIIFVFVLAVFSWILWDALATVVFIVAPLIPWGIMFLIMYLTFNNILNAIGKLPSVFGYFFGFICSLPFAVVYVTISIWTYAQTCLMGVLTFRGLDMADGFIANYVEPVEGELPGSLFLVRFYYEHFQWLWGGLSFMYSLFPWNNGVWCEARPLEIPLVILKLFILAPFYTVIFIIPFLPIIWGVMMPILGACSRLPAVSGNGDGKD